ncbi:expressed unknown protein [Seminavis robusta]|uniref:Uncharacterized protein n=1 Tax=Seminavis robusta TaxID=568900 RepID=A0A9N8DBM2_9STRA|nr:expressed unknown protein [Seminavis robusta]|eukprot:Sro46_g027470.1 n/a (493) ;mRNA; f:74366-75844
MMELTSTAARIPKESDPSIPTVDAEPVDIVTCGSFETGISACTAQSNSTLFRHANSLNEISWSLWSDNGGERRCLLLNCVTTGSNPPSPSSVMSANTSTPLNAVKPTSSSRGHYTGSNRNVCLFIKLTVFFLASFLAGMTVQQKVAAASLSTATIKTTTSNLRNTNGRTTSTTSTTIVYGHVHMAKTGGTNLNGMLATRYERVCGHKGYSYDAIAHNQRTREWQASTEKYGDGLYTLHDSITQIKPNYNRGRVPPKVMFEIGFQDCDWISLEDPGWRAWPHHVLPDLKMATTDANNDDDDGNDDDGNDNDATTTTTRLELHVPCRDPVDHLLSMCHYQSIDFDCSIPFESDVGTKKHNHDSSKQTADTTMEEQIDSCLMGLGRFHHELANLPHTDLKCFDYQQQDLYLQYMDQRLQPRRQQQTYVWRASDRKRHYEQECLGGHDNDDDVQHATKQKERLQERIANYLLKHHDYYRFCKDCRGSPQDLFPAAA